MLTYLVQVTEDLLVVAIFSGFVFGYADKRFDKSERGLIRWGCVLGWVAALVLAYLKNMTKLVDSGLWNLRFVGLYLVGLILFLVLLIPVIAKRGGNMSSLLARVSLSAMLIGITGYRSPEALGYPWAILGAVSTVVSTDFFFRMVGWVVCLALMYLVAFGTYKVVAALDGRISLICCVLSSVCCGLMLAGLGLRALITRRIIAQSPLAFKLAVFASNNNLLLSCVMAAMAAVCVVVLLVRSVRATEVWRNPAEHRKIRAKWRRRRRWSCVTCCCLAISVLNLTAIKDYDSREVELSPSEEFEQRDDGCYVSLEQVDDGHLHRFTYESPDGVGIRFIIIKKPGGNAYGIGLDACDICGETGYYERDGNQVVCKLCDVVMNVQTIGFKGGCNPLVIDYDISDGYIHIPFDTLLEHEAVFTR